MAFEHVGIFKFKHPAGQSSYSSSGATGAEKAFLPPFAALSTQELRGLGCCHRRKASRGNAILQGSVPLILIHNGNIHLYHSDTVEPVRVVLPERI